MSRAHEWERSFFPQVGEKALARPPVESWVRCRTCGTQVCQQGYGRKAQVFYRRTSEHAWTSEEPPCETYAELLASAEEDVATLLEERDRARAERDYWQEKAEAAEAKDFPPGARVRHKISKQTATVADVPRRVRVHVDTLPGTYEWRADNLEAES